MIISTSGVSCFAHNVDQLNLGRSIYEQGIGRNDREIRGTLHGSISLSGTAIACIGCHGKDGRGSSEAFIRASDIRWKNLTKSYSGRNLGSKKTSYDRVSFAKTLRSGFNSNEKMLDPAMPRLDLADDEVDGLIVYLSQLNESQDLTNNHNIILGIMPKPGHNANADKLDAKLKNCPTSDRRGPIAAIDTIYYETQEEAIAQLKTKLAQNPRGFVLSPYLIGWEDQYYDFIKSKEVITILPFSFINPPNDSRVYYSFPGIETQIIALLKSIKKEGYQNLYLHFEPADELSSRLKEFAFKIAIEIDIVPYEVSSNENRGNKFAVLWLKPISVDAIDKIRVIYEEDILMLAPALFSSQNLPSRNPNKLTSLKWRIAYPYHFPLDFGKEWLTPVDAWAQAICDFLALSGEGKITYNNLPEKLTFGINNSLFRRLRIQQSANQVYLKNEY